MLKTIFFISVLILVAVTVAPAHAEDDDARTLYKEGVDAFNAGNFHGAAKKFRAAYESRPAWRLLFNIGQSEAAAKRYGLALEALEQYVAEGGDELDLERREYVIAELDRLRAMVGFLKIKAPVGSVVQVDGMVRGKAPLDNELPVAIGPKHLVEVSSDGESFPSRNVKVFGGKTVELVFERDTEPVVSAPVEKVEDPGESDQSMPVEIDEEPAKLKIGGWVSVGLGGAFLITGAITGATALSIDNDLSAACEDGTCPNNESAQVKKMNNLGVATDVFFVAGGAAVATGLVLLIVDAKRGKSDGQETGETEISFAPTVAPGFAGAAFIGRF